MKVAGNYKGTMGQFYMLRGWSSLNPILDRPFSIFDLDGESISFLYKVIGEGTHLLSRLKENDDIKLFGPYGNGFPQVKGKVALIGGGLGLAPLYLAAKNLFSDRLVGLVHIYLGFQKNPILIDLFEKVSHRLTIDVGGYISQKININDYDYIFACGPKEMVEAVVKQKKSSNTRLYVSLEKRMGCGLGGCLSCTCETVNGNKLACKDGPVFSGEDIIFG